MKKCSKSVTIIVQSFSLKQLIYCRIYGLACYITSKGGMCGQLVNAHMMRLLKPQGKQLEYFTPSELATENLKSIVLEKSLTYYVHIRYSLAIAHGHIHVKCTSISYCVYRKLNKSCKFISLCTYSCSSMCTRPCHVSSQSLAYGDDMMTLLGLILQA